MIGDKKTLFPGQRRSTKTTRVLAGKGFVVLPYTNDDVVNARRGLSMRAQPPLSKWRGPYGSGLGIQNMTNLRIMREMITEVPLIVDAGVGTASDAAIAMELGADGIYPRTFDHRGGGRCGKNGACDEAGGRKGRQAGVEAGRMEKKALCGARRGGAGVVGG